MTQSEQPYATDIKLHRSSQRLETRFSDGFAGELTAEFLRVHSPSAEVKGHGPGEGVLVAFKQDVQIERIEPVGRYAIRLVFSDGHDTGLYTWPILYGLIRDQERLWQRYLDRLARSGLGRATQGRHEH